MEYDFAVTVKEPSEGVVKASGTIPIAVFYGSVQFRPEIGHQEGGRLGA
jgi:hypothetical protein